MMRSELRIHRPVAVALWATCILLSSCSDHGGISVNTPSMTDTNAKTNIIKVLNRVQCHENHIGTCMQSDFNGIWEVCIQNGYSTTISSSEVVTSRELKELVSGSVSRTMNKTNTIQKTDENGIVTETESAPIQVTVLVRYKGYCIGSEYVTKR
jgi:hypothetical protein